MHSCTSNVQFYVSPYTSVYFPHLHAHRPIKTPYNYGRALIWAGVMTGLSHLHPAFKSVFAIEAVNEPIMNAADTPGYGTCKQILDIIRW